eukprot:UN15498
MRSNVCKALHSFTSASSSLINFFIPLPTNTSCRLIT